MYDNWRAVSRDDTPWQAGRDVWWQDVVPLQAEEAEVEWVEAEDPLFLLYTSGSTGRPKVSVCTGSSVHCLQQLLQVYI